MGWGSGSGRHSDGGWISGRAMLSPPDNGAATGHGSVGIGMSCAIPERPIISADPVASQPKTFRFILEAAPF